ncbi:hypothetical protein JKP88DRAFT_279614 [Tribonema minus]|uniref:Uncharacterized protein n=1 Tax=Tribonema minus TaxID=303371 RepID=A0A836CCX4_9STRA|nr:hypothetical protein JKP88DRAFT_279614 [Tribonema minus]
MTPAAQVDDLATLRCTASSLRPQRPGFSSVVSDLSNGLASAERVFTLMDMTPTVPLDDASHPPAGARVCGARAGGGTFRVPDAESERGKPHSAAFMQMRATPGVASRRSRRQRVQRQQRVVA